MLLSGWVSQQSAGNLLEFLSYGELSYRSLDPGKFHTLFQSEIQFNVRVSGMASGGGGGSKGVD